MHNIFLYLLLLVNLITFALFGIDKYKARKGMWRIPEATLLLWAACFASPGAWIGMKVWHHKTMHKKFLYGVPALFLLQAALLIFLHTRLHIAL